MAEIPEIIEMGPINPERLSPDLHRRYIQDFEH